MVTQEKRLKSSARRKQNAYATVLSSLKKEGVFHLSEAIEKGLSQARISRLTTSGQLHRIGRGIYVHPDSELPPEVYDYSVACKRFGKESLIGGLTALSYYGLIEQVPEQIWLMVPPNIKTTDRLYRLVRTTTNPKVGIVTTKSYRISNLERTIIESLRYSSKIGLRVALKAARLALFQHMTTESKLLKLAQQLGLSTYVEKYWEAIVTE